uniref:Nucleolar protein 8 n=1 Tax=Leptobrachium leishanense TaxID=445787 RepID=A0A8C5PJD1_9ANUR
MDTPSKRLYIGGIGPSVTDIELTERFGKFGKVDGVEIISRKDEHGTPLKTFAYLNINVSDVNLKKCISTLNKTKWKGGLLQIEMAKESFLHRLSQERQASQEKKKPKTESKPSFVQSLKEAGVQDFQMKSAVPGTEVPNHKNWVVSKFGRVLPVLHLKGDHQRKSIKYDPSKYCHNIKRLEDNSVEMTPVSQLTWQLEGGDDDMSKKRRGEFPVFKSPVTKKLKLPTHLDTKGLDQKQKLNITPRWCDHVIGQSSSTSPSIPPPNKINCRSGTSKKNSMFDDEYDSEEELRNIIENEKKATKEDSAIVDDNNVEVVDDSFKVTYTSHWTPDKEPRSNAKDEEYDSADTDEIIAVSKSGQKVQDMDTSFKDDVIEQAVILTKKQKAKADSSKIQTQKPKRDAQCSADDESDSDSHEINIGKKDDVKKHSLLDKEQKSRLNSSGVQINKSNSKQRIKPAPDNKSDSDNQNEDSASDSSASYSDEEYSSMIQNCYNLSLSMADLEKLASEAKESSNDEAENANVDSQPEGKKTPQKLKTGSVTPKVKKGLTPDDIVASILADNDDSADDRRKKKKNTVSPLRLPAFRGLGSLLASAPSKESAVSPNSLVSTSNVKSAISKGNELQSSIDNDTVSSTKQTAIESDSRDISDSKAGQQDCTRPEIQGNQAVKINLRSSTSSETSSSDEGSSSPSLPLSPHNALQQTTPEKAAKHEKSKMRGVTKKLEDNKKRLAAMEERRVERELQKKAIQGALLKSDSKPSIKSQHIKFDSDSEPQSEKESDLMIVSPKKVQNATTKLFDSSDDESDEARNKDDVERFQVRSRFEGQAGVKLMNLQSRFGTDERFRMDSRFLDSSSEDEDAKDLEQKEETNEGEELFAEKRKNLDIINSLLNINPEPQPPSKQTAKAKKFKDLNSLHYDPTKDEHTTFETEEKKEGKSERKKKRQEAEKLPEVSTETYHEVMVDFKDVFGVSKPATENEDRSATWDQAEESEVVGAGDLVTHEYFNVQNEEAPIGFTFSFFGASTQDSACKEVPYTLEMIKPGRVAWHEDPRFQDSSSEGEEQEGDNAALDKDLAPSLQSGASKSNIRFFFFVKDDERLKVGPKMFFRTSNLDEEQEVWVGRRESLLEECLKRHKDAKRKIKAKH